jgi:hypothetical protein
MKKNRVKDAFLAHLRKVPIVQVACEQVDVSRNSVYKWRNTDPEFRKQMDEAMTVGELLINDMSESQLLSLIREKNWQAISFWLRHRNPRFKDKIEVTTYSAEEQEKLTAEQNSTVERGLAMLEDSHDDENIANDSSEIISDKHDTHGQPI